MQKYSYLFLLGILSIIACNKETTKKSKFPTDTTVQVNLTDTITIVDTLRLYVWNAIQVDEVAKVPMSTKGNARTATFPAKKYDRGLYYIGESLANIRPVLLGTEGMVSLEGPSGKFTELKVMDSDLNKEYEKLIARISSKNQYFMTLLSDYSENKDNEAIQLKAKKKMEIEDKEKKRILDSLVEAKSELARIMAFNAFQSYQNNGVSGQTEATYFAETFFQFVNLEDTVYTNLPFYYENVKNYAMALTSMGIGTEQQHSYLDSLIAKVPTTNPNHKPTLVGCMLGVMGRNNPLFVKYGKKYTELYKGDYPLLDKFVQEQTIKLKGAAAEGEIAPNLEGPTPDGATASLEQMRGKYVLIDFWASWCGPCRKENPNVVRLYNKYKDKGFDILGVSLDNNKDRWKNAIAQDKLTWTHISDLKGWSSSHAKMYGVRGIPYTVLVDKEGRIIAKRLRAHTLEAKLKEIFGE